MDAVSYLLFGLHGIVFAILIWFLIDGIRNLIKGIK